MCIRGKKNASCVITASGPTNEHVKIRFCKFTVHSGYATVGLCYVSPLNNGIFAACTLLELVVFN